MIESPRKSCLGCGLRRVAVCTASTLPSCISAHLVRVRVRVRVGVRDKGSLLGVW